MTRICTFLTCILATALTCSSCSRSDPSTPRGAPTADTPAAAGAQPAATTEATGGEMGIEARAILGKVPPAPETPAATLKPRYADKAAFLADLKAAHPSSAVELDGTGVSSGFGPPLRYRTNRDGSIGQ
jgi:hypothetical protein